MATPKKKHLIELMIEAGVKWPVGAEYAAQDKKDNKVQFYKNGKPNPCRGFDAWMGDNCTFLNDKGITLSSLCHTWNRTIVTREQYAEALTATAMTSDTQQETQPSPKYCASVMRQMPDNTIEQLTADYHAKAEEANRLQAVADDALLSLQKAGELIGLVISVDTMQKLPVQSEITNWRDLRIGDVIECVTQSNPNCQLEHLNWIVGEECEVVGLEEPGKSGQTIRAKFKNGEKWWIGKFRFIRRP